MMQGWIESTVCMMSGGGAGAESSREEGLIKQEDDRYCSLPDPRELTPSAAGNGIGQSTTCASPSTTVLYSPSTTALNSEIFNMKREIEEEFCPGITCIINPDDFFSDEFAVVSSSQSLFDYSDCVDEAVSSPRQVKRYREIPSSPSSPERHFCSSTTSADQLLSSPEGLKEEDAPKRLCLVCGDIASGFHYGVASCEACKAFFKRTIQGNIDYHCPATNDCEINKRRRKACQACRFHKCLRVGMLKEGVRVRGGRQKYRRTSDSPFALSQLPIKKTSLDDIKLLSDLQICEPELLQSQDLEIGCPKQELLTITTIAEIYDKELVQIIGWAKQIPGFTALALNDQMRLLQSTWGEILTLTLAYRSMPSSSKTLVFAQDFTIDETIAREVNAYDLFTQIIGVVERLEQCSILKEEYLLLKALVLTNSDVRVQDTQALHRLRQNILQAIHDAVGSLRARDATAHMQSLLLCLPSLRAADTCLRRFWLSVRQNGNVSLKKLFLEMLENLIR